MRLIDGLKLLACANSVLKLTIKLNSINKINSIKQIKINESMFGLDLQMSKDNKGIFVKYLKMIRRLILCRYQC